MQGEETAPLTTLALSGLALATAALPLAGFFLPARAIDPAMTGLCAVALLLTLVQAIGGGAAELALPIGLPGRPMPLGVDGMALVFLALLFTLGIAAGLTASASPPEAGTRALPCLVAAMALTLLAADGFGLLVGFALMAVATFAQLLGTDTEEGTAQLYLGVAILAGACLMAALALLGTASDGGFDLRFAAIRAHPPEGARAAAILALTLVGAGAQAGLAPLHVWLPPAHAAAPAHVCALLSGAMTKVAVYVMLRVLFDLCGPAQPMWWGVPLIAMGGASAVLGALRANLEPDLKTTLACSTIGHVGLIAIGLGLALCARAADLSALTELALAGALLHAMAHAGFKGLLFLAAGAVIRETGTKMFAGLGGLVHRMPVTSAAALLGVASLAGLPLSAGFGGQWTVMQAALAAPRIGGLWPQAVACLAVALIALAAGLGAAAAMRWFGIAFLGRPRMPRTAAADEVGRPAQAAMIGLGAVVALIGLVPGWFLPLAGPALRALALAGSPARDAGLTIAPQAAGPGYTPVGLAVAFGLLVALVIWAVRRHAASGHRAAPAWDGGFGAPPVWLPFGDPLTQASAASLAQPLRRVLGSGLLGARETLDGRGPGHPGAARLAYSHSDPAARLLFAPIGRLRAALSQWSDRLQLLILRRTLPVLLAVLVLALAALAVVEQL